MKEDEAIITGMDCNPQWMFANYRPPQKKRESKQKKNINKIIFWKKKLQWLPTYNISDSVKVTTEWYHRVLEKKEDPITVTDFQIEDYMHENNWS